MDGWIDGWMDEWLVGYFRNQMDASMICWVSE